MTLATGVRLGAYEIISAIGAGGMGEVYRAHDAKLGRDVAIKVLPASFALDPDRLARFEREARLLASLNHPHIAQIYGLERLEGQEGREGHGAPFIVMELVDGETLAERLARSEDRALHDVRRGRSSDRPILIAEALAIARQIADALDAAHERGIVHRDLKPANIVITPEGVVKVLDFGLAKAEAGSASLSGERELTHSPTVMAPTIDGVLLGTAPYMSPEQARGKAVDKRADIWAFGCVLYEMLTGRRAFVGETTTDVLAKIVECEPDWSALPASTPPHIVRLLQRCLDKDPKRRWRDIGDVQVELDTAGAITPSAPPSSSRARLVVPVLATAAIGALAALAWVWLHPPSVRQRAAQFAFAAPDGQTFEVSPPVPSPDGRRIAFVSRDASGQRALWIRASA